MTSAGEKFGLGLRALVVDDEPTTQALLRQLLEREGFATDVAGTRYQADRCLNAATYDLVLADKNLPDGNGLDVVKRIGDERRDCAVIVMSAYANTESALSALRMSVPEFVVKPFTDVVDVRDRVRRVVEHLRLQRENRQLVDQLQDKNARLEELSVRDNLTELFNHAFFQYALENELRRSSRYEHEFGLIFADIDRFKEINDLHGHPVGDAVLKEIAALLRGASQPGDTTFRLRSQDLAARYGGDEFVVVLPETSKTNAALKAEQIRAMVEGHTFESVVAPVTLSLGVTGYPTDGEDRGSLMNAADAALHAAKNGGRNRVVSYRPSLIGSRRSDGGSESDLLVRESQALERVLAKRSVQFLYQPIVDTMTQTVFGYEALCRSTEAEFATVLDLIDAAERLGRVASLGRVLRESALAPIAALREPGLLFVNLHPHELYDPHLLDPEPFMAPWARRLVLEITEVVAIKNYERLREAIARLHALGFRVALDDLGAGYAGLNMLAQLDADIVKIDRSLVHGLPTDARTVRLVKHLLEYAAGEGIAAIAEGIETRDEANVVSSLGCRLMQGHYFARPAPPFVDPVFGAPPSGGNTGASLS